MHVPSCEHEREGGTMAFGETRARSLAIGTITVETKVTRGEDVNMGKMSLGEHDKRK